MIGLKMQLRQARNGIIETINNNKITGVIHRHSMIVNEFGQTIPNPDGSYNKTPIACMISHEQEGTFKNQTFAPGLGTQFDRYILVNHKTDIQEDDLFVPDLKWNMNNWRIGPVDKLMKFNGIIGYQAPLFKADSV